MRKKRANTHDLAEWRRAEMRRRTEAFARGEAFPPAVYDVLEARGVGPRGAVILENRTPPQECCAGTYAALLLTAQGKFVDFEIDLDWEPRSQAPIKWNDVTYETTVDERVPAIGTSDGWLALRLFDELEAEGVLDPRGEKAP